MYTVFGAHGPQCRPECRLWGALARVTTKPNSGETPLASELATERTMCLFFSESEHLHPHIRYYHFMGSLVESECCVLAADMYQHARRLFC